MVTVSQYSLWLGVTIAEILAIYIAIECRQLQRFWDLYVYLGLSCVTSFLRYVILQQNGLQSAEYAYFYYYSDAILTISLSLVAVRLLGHVYNLRTWKGIPLRVAIPGMLFAAIFSYGGIESAHSKLFTHFVIGLSQNLYFGTLLLMTAAWIGALLKKLHTSAEVKLIWVLTIYFVIFLAVYGARILYPASYYLYSMVLTELAALWLTAGSTFAVLFDDRQTG